MYSTINYTEDFNENIKSNEFQSIVELLKYRSIQHSNQLAIEFLNEDLTVTSATYAELDHHARRIAATLQERECREIPIPLFYYPCLEFIEAFLGCLYAGALPVPFYVPGNKRSQSRTLNLIKRLNPRMILSNTETQSQIQKRIPELQELEWIASDTLEDSQSTFYQNISLCSEDVAFLQFTSGSTSNPKGVMITHGNILHNSHCIQTAFGNHADSSGCLWLPPYHDMGLIGGILQPIYLGARVTLMTPMHFLRSPLQWLQIISEKRITTGGGPNFAYDYCVQKISDEEIKNLDLTCWEVAFVGAEPVRASTLKQFYDKFRACGFRYEAFLPCYGMAESTLIVTGGPKEKPPVICSMKNEIGGSQTERQYVGCGIATTDLDVRIVNPETGLEVAEGQSGEVWVAGGSVAKGYYRDTAKTEVTFQNRLPGSERNYMRTGDLGFMKMAELFITGRMKDLLIIRGQNYYPQDMEEKIAILHADFINSGTVAFAIENEQEEHLVILQEMNRHRQLPFSQATDLIRNCVMEYFELPVWDVVFVFQSSLPRTTSGKIQRYLCKEEYLNKGLKPLPGQETGAVQKVKDIASLTYEQLQNMDSHQAEKTLVGYIKYIISEMLNIDVSFIESNQCLKELGLDSQKHIELKSRIGMLLGKEFVLYEFSEKTQLAQIAQLAARSIHVEPAISTESSF